MSDALAPAASARGAAGHADPLTVPAMDAAAAGTISTDERVVVLDAGREVTFGRAPTTLLRIGHAPVYDDVVPKLAGKVFVHDGRVVVANLHDVLALDIRVQGRPLISLAPGDWHSPPRGHLRRARHGHLHLPAGGHGQHGEQPHPDGRPGGPRRPRPPDRRPAPVDRPPAAHPRRLRGAARRRGAGRVAPAGGRDGGDQSLARAARVPQDLERAAASPASPCARWAMPATRSPTPGPATASDRGPDRGPAGPDAGAGGRRRQGRRPRALAMPSRSDRTWRRWIGRMARTTGPRMRPRWGTPSRCVNTVRPASSGSGSAAMPTT